ncbi:hypothetical protein I5Q36_24505 [Serratia ureilytica]|nr:hypothetical protein [Serratia ureilytica]
MSGFSFHPPPPPPPAPAAPRPPPPPPPPAASLRFSPYPSTFPPARRVW